MLEKPDDEKARNTGTSPDSDEPRKHHDVQKDGIRNRRSFQKKRVVAQRIENKRGKTFSDYRDEFDCLISAGIVLEMKAISTPVFPLSQSTYKNLLKLYLAVWGC